MAFMAMAVFNSFISMGHKKEDKSIEVLWSDYDKAAGDDRIQQMADILGEIKVKALKSRAVWDYYKACDRYVDVRSMRNWKVRDSLETGMREEILAFDEPVLSYLVYREMYGATEVLDKVRDARKLLESRRNPEVYDGRGMILNPAVVPYVRDDYEYVIWDMYGRFMHDVRIAEEIYAMIEEKAGGFYPLSGLAEYFHIVNVSPGDRREEQLRDLALRYEGKAVSLLPGLKLLEMEFESRREVEGHEFFLEFYGRVESYEHERGMYRSGPDKVIAKDCDGFSMLLDHLKSKAVKMKISDGQVELALRNLKKIKVRFTKARETVYETELVNPAGSFYVFDDVRMELPRLDDGDYSITCLSGRDELGNCTYPKFTLSVASRNDKDGVGVYVADYLSGKPVETVDMELYKGGRKIAEASGVHMKGFTPLPESIASRVEKSTSGHYIVCKVREADGRLRRSDEIYLGGSGRVTRDLSGLSAVVMPERTAFRPGETVRFKAIVYESSSDGRMDVSSSRAVTLRLRDAQGNVLVSQNRRTNEFGSVAGEFGLDDIKRNGLHTIQVYYGERLLGSASLTVDEFVLPTFGVSFDRPVRTFFPGDTVEVSGRLESFSGHSLASADVTAHVSIGGRSVRTEALKLDREGRFRLSFHDVSAEDDRYPLYDVELKVIDMTGETLSFFFRQPVLSRPYLRSFLDNAEEGRCRLKGNSGVQCCILSDDVAYVSCGAAYPNGDETVDVPMEYRLEKDGKKIADGKVVSGGKAELDFSRMEPGLYRFVLSMSVKDSRGGTVSAEKESYIAKVCEGEDLASEFEDMFMVLSDDEPSLRFGSGSAPVWAVVEMLGNDGTLLNADLVHLEAGESEDFIYSYGEADAVTVNVLYFRNSGCHTFSRTWRKPVESDDLPLEVVRFTEECMPGSECSLVLRTGSEAEVLASVFDVATEHVRKNVWREIKAPSAPLFNMMLRRSAGRDGNGYEAFMGDMYYCSDMLFEGAIDENVVVGYGTRSLKAARTGNMDYVSVEEESVEDAAPVREEENIDFREDFAASLAFEPFLRPDEDGNICLDFKTSDKISTFVVSLFAHDKSMNNTLVRKNILVTLPVKVDVMQPQYLYEGDAYCLKVSVSNNLCSSVKGILAVIVTGEHGLPAEYQSEMDIPAGESVPVSVEVPVAEGVGSLDFKVVFSGGSVSDGISFKVPVHPSAQILTESHSAVLLDGMSEDEIIGDLRNRFVNVPSVGAEYVSRSIMDMLREALPLVKEIHGKDVISQSEAMCVNLMAAGLRAAEGEDVRPYVEAAMSAVGKMLACADADGGFAWFEGMKSSPVVTAVLLERYAGLRDRGLLTAVSEEMGEDSLDELAEAVADAVAYLDRVFFSEQDRPVWYGMISQWQYMNVRAMYAGIPFDEKMAAKRCGVKKYSDFRKSAKAWLVPEKGERWTSGAILSKVRMLRVLNDLSSSEQGLQLARAWGIGLGAERRLRKSIDVERNSLKEYAVPHKSGGMYFPNAVMPLRGLLESEAYAHAMICEVLPELADGVRIWIMLQKETQEWTSDPGFVEAMAAVYDASDAVKNTRVIVLSKRYQKSLDEIKAAGNGFTVSVEYFRELHVEGKEAERLKIEEGDVLEVGESIVALYSVWSEENRSFVRLSVPRPACLRPAEQLSGWEGGWLRTLNHGIYRIAPYSYREVKDDRTLYWMDVFPEEHSVIEEKMYVTQKGVFRSPVSEIQSMYAPHYRANDSSHGTFVVR